MLFGTFKWCGGHPALDFVNTVTWSQAGLLRERLGTYGDLLAWSRDARLLRDSEVETLSLAAKEHPKLAQAAFTYAIDARTDLHDLFVSVASASLVDKALLRRINKRISDALSHVRLAASGIRFERAWADPSALTLPTRAVIRAAFELIVVSDIERVRICANPNCGWVFVDRSRRSNRRWCSMDSCGSTSKARRYYWRKHAEQ